MTLADRVAFVTGGGGGLGRAVALGLAKEGASVGVADLSSDAAAAVAEDIRRAGGVAASVAVDVARKSSVVEAVSEVNKALGTIDILVNCAGIYPKSLVVDMPEEEWDRVLNVNLKGTFLACQAVIPGMQKKRFGKIVSLSSGHGFKGGKATAHYSASKAGVVVFTKSLALELAEYGINVNAVAPGIADTEMPRRVMTEEQIKARLKKIPLGRLCDPQDIADAVVFLVSDESKYMTGQTIYVNGGDPMP